MVKYSVGQIDATFRALADPTRRSILERLADGEARVTELAQPYDISLPAISRHLRVLRRAGLIEQEADGRIRRCRLRAEPLRDAADWLKQYQIFWEDQLASLADFVEQEPRKETPT